MACSPQITIVADDLTGAADAAVSLVGRELVTIVSLDAQSVYPADAHVVSTESRDLPEVEATDAVRTALHDASKITANWYYKKIDSTLRGHPGKELAAMMDALDMDRALIAPALPTQGRTTVAGRQRINGVAVEQTSFAKKVRSSDVVGLFRQADLTVRLIELDVVRAGCSAVGEILDASGTNLFVADAETQSDLLTVAGAAALSDVRLLCGSDALLAALAQTVTWQPQAPQPQLPPAREGPGFVVALSRHPATARQITYAQQHGAQIVQPGAAFFEADVAGDSALGEQIGDQLKGGRDVVLTTAGLDDALLGGRQLAERIAQVVGAVLADFPVGSLTLTGGDAAAAVCAALNASALWLRGEVAANIPHGRLLGGPFEGLAVITKAGGFGEDDALHAAIQLGRS